MSMTTSVFDPDTELDARGGESWKGRKAPRMVAHGREIKMLRPICAECEDEAGGVKYLRSGWQNECQHDPYVSYFEVPRTRPIYETSPDGLTKTITGTETTVHTEARPNWTSVSQSAGLNTGRGPNRALLKGFIFPQQLRSPLWPRGIKARCQFRDCFAEDLKHYPGVGWFCDDVEAAMVYASDRGKVVQIPQGEREVVEKRQDQIAGWITKAKAEL